LLITNIYGQTELLTDYQIKERKRVVNGDYSLPFVVFKTERNQHSFDLVQEESIVEYDGQQYRIKKMREYVKGSTPVKDITQCSHVFFDIIDDYQYETITGTKSMVQALTHVFSVTDWTWINHGAFTGVVFENFGDGNALELFQTVLERYGAEFEITGETEITIKNQIGSPRDAQFRYRHNIKTLYKDIDSSNISTYIKGFGKDGIETEYTSAYSMTYGIRHAPPVRDDRFTDVFSLLEHLQKVIQDTPNITIEIEAVELKNQGIPIHEYGLGDTIYLIHEDLGIDSTVRILEFTDYPETNQSPKVVLSNYQKTLTSVLTSFQQTSKTLKQLTDSDGNISLAVKRLYRNSNHFSDHTGDWYISPDDPNAYVHIGAGGLDVHKGLVRVEREDGYASIIGGVIQHHFAVQSSYPPFRTAGIVEEGPWLSTISNSRFENIQMYSFKHESRYLVAKVGTMTEYDNFVTIFFDIDTSDGDGQTATNIGSLVRTGGSLTSEITMDLGVPDGTMKSVYVRMISSNTTMKAYGRILSMRLEG
jgi:phage minor structural protein